MESEVLLQTGLMTTIAIDAGGTYLKAGVLKNGILLPELSFIRPSHSNGTSEQIVGGLADLILELSTAYRALLGIEDYTAGFVIGLAFPGPFEYESGISRIQGLNKYDSIYGLNLKALLRDELTRRAELNSSWPWLSELAAAPIRLSNDAVLFSLGVSRLFPEDKMVCLTLGTGLGSTFIEKQKVVLGRSGIPATGMLYEEMFNEERVDDVLGSRGILSLADSLHARSSDDSVQNLAFAAQSGDPSAIQVWKIYGQRLGLILRPYISAFRPDKLVLGGQIAKSRELFEDSLQSALMPEQVVLYYENDVQGQVFYGIQQMFDTIHNIKEFSE
ncbi:ROK family protein [Paenibacillus sp. FSL R10-2734]|uniref:ROK family protein n=1 Tax=Paenibacillus sp. FSL R10-2734 TaxID=2954691 RepID=UPI0030D95A84